jgi:hypothetical protein
MSRVPNGEKLLEKMGVTEKMSNLLLDKSINRQMKIGVIKFWGYFLFNQSSNLNHFDKVTILNGIETAMEESVEILNACITAVANIGSAQEGLLALYDHQTLLQKTLEYSKNASGDSKASCLAAICCLLNHQSSKDIDIPSMTSEIFRKICNMYYNISSQQSNKGSCKLCE